jgi:hypothetical protein
MGQKIMETNILKPDLEPLNPKSLNLEPLNPEPLNL